MDIHRLPSVILTGVGLILLGACWLSFRPSLASGPGVLWMIFLLVILGGGGLIATVIGIITFHQNLVRFPLIVLSLYLGVGLVYGSIRLMLFPSLSVVAFSIIAFGFVVVLVSITEKVIVPRIQTGNDDT